MWVFVLDFKTGGIGGTLECDALGADVDQIVICYVSMTSSSIRELFNL